MFSIGCKESYVKTTECSNATYNNENANIDEEKTIDLKNSKCETILKNQQ